MNWIGAVAVFLVVWWTVLFAVLPFGVKSRWESEDDGVAGAEVGAPVNPDLRRKALVTTVIAAVVTAIIWAVVESGVLLPKE